MLAFEGLTVRLPGRAEPVLDGVSLRLQAGQMLALVGASGAGKSTVLRAACGMLPADAVVAGRVLLAGAEVRDWAAARGRLVAPVFQAARAGLSPVRRIDRQIADALALGGQGTVSEVLARFGLDPSVGRMRAGELSGGMAQRVAIARAWATGARVILADEPTSALDPVNARRVIEVLAAARDGGRAVLLVTHDPGLAVGHADGMALLEGGRIGPVRPPSAFLGAPVGAEVPLVAALRARIPARVAPVGPEVLRVEGLVHRHPGGADLSVSLTLARGEVLAVVGASGAGKTTLARQVARLDRCQGGGIWLEGVEIGGMAPARFARDPLRGRVQLVFQEAAASFVPWRAVGRGISGEAARLAGVEAGWLTRRPAQLSHGQMARVALARALVPDPAVLVLDEPLAALDPQARAALAVTLAGLRDQGMAMVLIAHDPGLVRGLADRVAVMDRGRIVETGPVVEVLARPQHAVTRALVAAIPGAIDADGGAA